MPSHEMHKKSQRLGSIHASTIVRFHFSFGFKLRESCIDPVTKNFCMFSIELSFNFCSHKTGSVAYFYNLIKLFCDEMKIDFDIIGWKEMISLFTNSFICHVDWEG